MGAGDVPFGHFPRRVMITFLHCSEYAQTAFQDDTPFPPPGEVRHMLFRCEMSLSCTRMDCTHTSIFELTDMFNANRTEYNMQDAASMAVKGGVEERTPISLGNHGMTPYYLC